MKDRIHQIRLDAKLTTREFADRIGINNSSVSMYETGKRAPSNAVVTAICKEFNINKAWLMNGEGPMKSELPDDDGLAEVVDCYENKLTEALKEKVRVLASLDAKWWETLDKALAEAEKIKAGRD